MAKLKSKAKIQRWDVAAHLNSEEEIVACLEAALEDGDPTLVAAALADIARARGAGSS
jgi:probable addiction module antidote protein